MKEKLIRFWCSKCQEFTIQYFNGPCTICGTINESYKLSDVPKEKIEAQRKRYKEWQYKQRWGVYNILNPFLMDSDPFHLFSDIVPARINIIEDDAGQKQIDEAHRRQVEERIEERRKLVEEYRDKYKGINRNDKCPCGSGKKYKHCHQDKFRGL